MTRQSRGPLLIAPREPAARVLRELDVVRRIRVNIIAGLERKILDIAARELPTGERRSIGQEIASVADAGITSERAVLAPCRLTDGLPLLSCPDTTL